MNKIDELLEKAKQQALDERERESIIPEMMRNAYNQGVTVMFQKAAFLIATEGGEKE